MTREERAILLRSRLRPVKSARTEPLGMYRTTHPRALDRRELKRKPYQQKPEMSYLQWMQYSTDHSQRASKWFKAAVPQPEDALVAKAPNGMEVAAAIEDGWKEAGLLPPAERVAELNCL